MPIRAGEQVIGVICVQGPPGELHDDSCRRSLDWVEQRTGARVAEQRAAEKDPVLALQAGDMVAGLMWRLFSGEPEFSALENVVIPQLANGVAKAVAEARQHWQLQEDRM